MDAPREEVFVVRVAAPRPVRRRNAQKKTRWTAEEDARLRAAVRTFESTKINWRKVSATYMDGTKTAKQCRERWANVLNPSLVRAKWTEEDLDTLFKAHEMFGRRWSHIAAQFFPGRPENSVKNAFYATQRRRARQAKRESQQGGDQVAALSMSIMAAAVDLATTPNDGCPRSGSSSSDDDGAGAAVDAAAGVAVGVAAAAAAAGAGCGAVPDAGAGAGCGAVPDAGATVPDAGAAAAVVATLRQPHAGVPGGDGKTGSAGGGDVNPVDLLAKAAETVNISAPPAVGRPAIRVVMPPPAAPVSPSPPPAHAAAACRAVATSPIATLRSSVASAVAPPAAVPSAAPVLVPHPPAAAGVVPTAYPYSAQRMPAVYPQPPAGHVHPHPHLVMPHYHHHAPVPHGYYQPLAPSMFPTQSPHVLTERPAPPMVPLPLSAKTTFSLTRDAAAASPAKRRR